MAYSREQRRNIGIALRMTRRDPGRVRNALLKAMAVESNFRHVNYGDRDSLGVLQQRPSMGWGQYRPGAKGVKQDIRDFLVRARKTNRSFRGTSGQLAQAVQRSAFPERYDQRGKEVQAIISKFKELGGMSPAFGGMQAKGFGGGGGMSRQALLNYVMMNNHAIASGTFDPASMGLTLAAALKSYREGTDLGTPSRPQALNANGRVRSRAQAMAHAMKVARKRFGLSVRENPMYDHVDPVHVEGSDHYKKFKGTNIGRAADISGDPRKERAFVRWLTRRYGGTIDDLFHDPLGWSYDEGRRVRGNLAPGHQHVHFSF